MALFSRKDKKDTKKTAAPTVHKAKADAVHADQDFSRILLKPRITEKAVGMSDRGVYVFEVARDANKYQVRDAVRQIYGVTPRKVAIVNRQPRPFVSRMRGRRGVHPGLKKAYVYLAADDRIELI